MHGSQETEIRLVIRMGKYWSGKQNTFCLQTCLYSEPSVVKAFNLLHQREVLLLLQCELSPLLNPTLTVLVIAN